LNPTVFGVGLPPQVVNVPGGASVLLTKIAIFVPRFRVERESVHENADHDAYDDARLRRSYS
jgi:hypothetical protein